MTIPATLLLRLPPDLLQHASRRYGHSSPGERTGLPAGAFRAIARDESRGAPSFIAGEPRPEPAPLPYDVEVDAVAFLLWLAKSLGLLDMGDLWGCRPRPANSNRERKTRAPRRPVRRKPKLKVVRANGSGHG